MIDYACGAGHFLTEAVEAINCFTKTDEEGKPKDNAWARDHIFGIEKDYRLARVAKISLFMNGAGEGNIIFGDGLENAPDKGIENGTFDILVANPPYSVKDFKQHLQLKNNTFTLLDRIGLNGGEIETLFVERIAQLLKPQGIAAVILPSTILSVDSACYIGAREQILQNFYIRGIAAFSSKTFGATGQNTVVLFLEKFNEPPKKIDLFEDSVDAIFGGETLDDWQDKDILNAFLAQIEVDEGIYQTFLAKHYSISDLMAIEYFRMYVIAFSDSAEAKNLLKTRSYKNKPVAEQEAAYLEKFYKYAFSIEREKLVYFSLIYQQKTAIIMAPTDNKEQKEFLGYNWSNRKGNEGIQIVSPGGKMYSNEDRRAENTLASVVRNSFMGRQLTVDENLKKYASIVCTHEMLNFCRPSFTKAINITTAQRNSVVSKYPRCRLDNKEKFLITIGKRVLSTEINQEEGIPVFSANVVEPFGHISKDLLEDFTVPSVLWGIDGDWMVNYIPQNFPFYPTDHCGVLRVLDKELSPYYVSLILYIVGKLHGFSRSYRASIDRIREVEIPIPPVGVQRSIVEDCKTIEDEYKSTRMSTVEYRERIEKLFAKAEIIAPAQE